MPWGTFNLGWALGTCSVSIEGYYFGFSSWRPKLRICSAWSRQEWEILYWLHWTVRRLHPPWSQLSGKMLSILISYKSLYPYYFYIFLSAILYKLYLLLRCLANYISRECHFWIDYRGLKLVTVFILVKIKKYNIKYSLKMLGYSKQNSLTNIFYKIDQSLSKFYSSRPRALEQSGSCSCKRRNL